MNDPSPDRQRPADEVQNAPFKPRRLREEYDIGRVDGFLARLGAHG
jgi:hypothetical protein